MPTARDGRVERPDDEGHLESVLAISPPLGAHSSAHSTVGWYHVVAHVERGSEKESQRAALEQLQTDARLVAEDPLFRPAELYFRLRRLMRDNADFQRHPSLWEPIAQQLKDASSGG